MNTEDRLRRASQEVDKATSSLSAAPIGEVRRSARMRSVGVAMAAAVGAIVLVGGAVLALGPGGEGPIAPAGPSETTATSAAQTTASAAIPDTVLVRAAESLTHPVFDIDKLGEQLPAVFSSRADVDVALALEQLAERGEGLRYGAVEALSLGSGSGFRGYVLLGELHGKATDTKYAYCSVLVSDSEVLTDCVEEGGSAFLELSRVGSSSFVVLGAVPDDASVVSLELGDQHVWTMAREGFVFMVRPDRPEPAVVTVYAETGEVLVWGEDPEVQVDVGTTSTISADPSCSAGIIAPSALALSSVPQPVAQTLFEIVEAGQECDFETLAAVGGGNVHASFGGDDASELWTFQEEQGYEPMYWLMSVLDLPYGTVDVGGEVVYVWPAAATHDGEWDTMPEEYIEQLRAIYTDEDFQGFADFGAYIGYRTGITESGEWTFFVAGD